MGTDPQDNTPDTPDTITPDDVQDGQEPDTEEQDEWTPPDKAAWEKIQAKAEKRDKLLREAQAKIRELEGPKDDEPSEADKLRAGMVRTAGRAALAGAGITDKADQAVILDVLRLDGIEVDEAGEVDTDALEERIGELRRILAAPAAPSRKVPPVSSRDRGGRNAEPADPDKARYRRIMGATR